MKNLDSMATSDKLSQLDADKHNETDFAVVEKN